MRSPAQVERMALAALATAWEQGWRARSEAEAQQTVIPANPYGLGYREEDSDA